MPFSKYSPKQKKLARIAEPRDAITGADFAALKKKPKKMAGGGKIANRRRENNAIVRYALDKASVRLKKDAKKFLKEFDDQEFKVQDIPTPKI